MAYQKIKNNQTTYQALFPPSQIASGNFSLRRSQLKAFLRILLLRSRPPAETAFTCYSSTTTAFADIMNMETSYLVLIHGLCGKLDDRICIYRHSKFAARLVFPIAFDKGQLVSWNIRFDEERGIARTRVEWSQVKHWRQLTSDTARSEV